MNALSGRIRLDFRSDEPLYVQMVGQIEALVKEGVLKPGDQLPTVRELAIDLRVNFSTVARVYRILDERRLISTQRGRGTYIWDREERDGEPESADTQGLPVGEDAVERQEKARRLVRRLIKEGLQAGLSLVEIEEAFNREAHSKKNYPPAGYTAGLKEERKNG